MAGATFRVVQGVVSGHRLQFPQRNKNVIRTEYSWMTDEEFLSFVDGLEVESPLVIELKQRLHVHLLQEDADGDDARGQDQVPG